VPLVPLPASLPSGKRADGDFNRAHIVGRAVAAMSALCTGAESRWALLVARMAEADRQVEADRYVFSRALSLAHQEAQRRLREKGYADDRVQQMKHWAFKFDCPRLPPRHTRHSYSVKQWTRDFSEALAGARLKQARRSFGEAA